MIRLDSLDLTLDTDPLPVVAYDRLRRTEMADPTTGDVLTAWTADTSLTGLHGFNGLRATQTGVSFRLTAQALGNLYTQGISRVTLDTLCDRLNGTGLVSVSPAALRNGVVRRSDPFADVRTADLSDVPAALRLVGRTLGDGAHTKGRGDAITLYRRLPDREGMLRAYGKDRQLQLARHRTFREAYPAAVESLIGRTRFEVEAQTYHAARRLAGIAEGRPTLGDLLDSTRCPVSDALDGMLDTWTGRRRALNSMPSLPPSLDAMLARPAASFREDSTALMAALIADLCGGDYAAACEAVRTRYGTQNGARLYPHVRAACEAYGRPRDSGDARAEAANVLGVVSTRVRNRERA